MSRRKRYFTIMIVPHSEESTYSFKVPLIVGQLLAALFIIGLASFVIVVYSNLHLRAESEEASQLRQVVQVQEAEINAFAYETQKLLEQMQQIDVLVKLVEEKLELNLDKHDQGAVTNNLNQNNPDHPNSTGRTLIGRSGTGVLDRAAGNLEVLQMALPEQADSLENIKVEVEEYSRRLAATPSIWPASGRITSGFGNRRSPFNRRVIQFHKGIDIANQRGTHIYAAADGIVTTASYRGSYGNVIIIDHGYGYRTLYAHLSGFSVSSGERVSKGQVIGFMGSTGSSTGTHLHYEVHVNGVPVNPMNYM